MPVTEITTESQLDEYIINNKYLFIDFYATWCGPCRQIAPAISTLSETYKDIIFLKVDIDQCEGVTERFGITGLPTFLSFSDGTLSGTIKGANLQAIEYSLKMMIGEDQPTEEF